MSLNGIKLIINIASTSASTSTSASMSEFLSHLEKLQKEYIDFDTFCDQIILKYGKLSDSVVTDERKSLSEDGIKNINKLIELIDLTKEKIQIKVNELTTLKDLTAKLQEKLSLSQYFNLAKIPENFSVKINYFCDLAPEDDNLLVGVDDPIQQSSEYCCSYDGYTFEIGLYAAAINYLFYKLEITISYTDDFDFGAHFCADKYNGGRYYLSKDEVHVLNGFSAQIRYDQDIFLKDKTNSDYHTITDADAIRFGHFLVRTICDLYPKEYEYQPRFEQLFTSESSDRIRINSYINGK